jgi:hypothetical protein
MTNSIAPYTVRSYCQAKPDAAGHMHVPAFCKQLPDSRLKSQIHPGTVVQVPVLWRDNYTVILTPQVVIDQVHSNGGYVGHIQNWPAELGTKPPVAPLHFQFHHILHFLQAPDLP